MVQLLKIEDSLFDEKPFLPPIDKPAGIFMKLAYFFTKKKFGKVISPLKVHSARLPASFGRFYTNVPNLDKKLTLDKETVLFLRELVARTNVCRFCIDSNRAFVISQSMNLEKFRALEQYNTNSLFTEKDRAALNYAFELTKNKEVGRETFDKLLDYFNEREICEIVYVIASEHLYNITNIGLNINSDKLCDTNFIT